MNEKMTWDEFHRRLGKKYKELFENDPFELFGMRAQIDFDSKHGVAKKRAEQRLEDEFFDELERKKVSSGR